jgi:hypothetical protein
LYELAVHENVASVLETENVRVPADKVCNSPDHPWTLLDAGARLGERGERLPPHGLSADVV